MSTVLSEALRKVIAEHSVVVAHLAKDTSIDRTTLQHIIGGRRSPNKSQIDKILYHIPIPEHKKKMVFQAFEITTRGADRYQQQEKVKTVIEKIAFASAMKPSFTAPNVNGAATPNAEESEELHGILAINNALINIINQEEESVSFFMPSHFPIFYDTLFVKYMTSQTLAVTCFFPMSNEEGGIIHDLEYCESFIPFFASPKHSFRAYYMREQSSLHDTSIIPFPYFVHTSKHVLLLSADMKHAILTGQETFVRIYGKKCREFLNVASPLFLSPPLGDMIMFFPNKSSSKDVFAALENQPCFQYYLTEQIIKKYAVPTSKEQAELVEKYTKYIHDMIQEPDLFSAFGQEGLDYFVETGYIAVWPPSLGKPLDVPDRIELLERMLHDIKNDVFHCRLVDASKFTIPRPTVTIAIRRKTLFVQVLDYKGGNVKNICLSEKNIVDAFSDFLANLPDTNLIHSKKETVRAFETALERLKVL